MAKFKWHCRLVPWSLGLGVECSIEEEMEVLLEPSLLKGMVGFLLVCMQELLMVQVKITDSPAIGISGM